MAEKNSVKKEELKDPGVIIEGQAEILLLEKNVFYNPVQEFNRDLSILALSVFSKNRRDDEKETIDKVKKDAKWEGDKDEKNESKDQDGITILEALSATGLRSIRYAKEVPCVKQIVANDISARAVECIKKNISHNKVEDLVTASHEDATMLMYQRRKDRFDVVDLDPYGCPSIFLDGAVQCIVNGGLLMVTATDMAVLAGNSPETCYVKYGAVSLKSKCCHEMALRILLQHIAMHAGRYGRYIVPLLSISVDFYIRVFVTVHSGQLQCKSNTSKLGMVYQCNGCESMTIQPLGLKKSDGAYKLPNGPAVDRLCKFCQHAHHIGGPIWLGLLHDKTFVSQLLSFVSEAKLETKKRLEGVLSVIFEELEIPLYYALDRLMSIVRCQTPPIVTFRSALLHAGYRVTYSHANKVSIKTDAPNEIIWDIVRAWEKNHQSRRDRMEKGSAALAILEAPTNTNVQFYPHPEANPRSRRIHMARFQVNPTANWGPGARSTTIVDPNETISKRKRNQNKHSKNRLEQMESEENVKQDENPIQRIVEANEVKINEAASENVENGNENEMKSGASHRDIEMDVEENTRGKEREISENVEDDDEHEPASKQLKTNTAYVPSDV